MQFKELYGPSLITGFAHLCDHLIGVIGNSGPLTDEACLKVHCATYICYTVPAFLMLLLSW